MNKKMLFFGSRNKADYLLFIAHVIVSLKKRVLIVDFTQAATYRHGYTRLKENENLFDYQGIDILVGANEWGQVQELLTENSEQLENYDAVLIDVDSENSLLKNWPSFDEVAYMGDFDRVNLMYDSKMINEYVKRYPKEKLRRITFGTKYKINSNTLETFLKGDVIWNSVHIVFEADESIEELRLEMQHQLTLPFRHINSIHREHIIGLVSEFYELHVTEIKEAIYGNKGSIFGKLFSRSTKDSKSKKVKNESPAAPTDLIATEETNELLVIEK